MAKTTRALSPTEVSKAKPGEKERSLADGGGLFLRIRPSGVKSCYSRPITKKRANLRLGT